MPAGPESSQSGAARSGRVMNAAESYYRGLCLRKLGQEASARGVFEDLVKTGQETLEGADAGAVPGDASRAWRQMRATRAAAHYAAGLGYLGLHEDLRARDELSQALRASPDHLGARTTLARLKRP